MTLELVRGDEFGVVVRKSELRPPAKPDAQEET
jgi:hypothetical protein